MFCIMIAHLLLERICIVRKLRYDCGLQRVPSPQRLDQVSVCTLYLKWISLCYEFVEAAPSSRLANDQKKSFLVHMAKRHEEWQVKQADTALRLYDYFLSRETRAPSKKRICRKRMEIAGRKNASGPPASPKIPQHGEDRSHLAAQLPIKHSGTTDRGDEYST
jgi:hypothetical protein